MAGTITFGTASAAPGARRYGTLAVGNLADGTPIEIPVVVVNGAREGKRLFLQAGVHGKELNPIEVLRRVVTGLEPAGLAGVLVGVISANPLSFVARDRRAPYDLEDMNRVWPGKADGAISQRMAHAIYEGGVRGSDALVDLHTGSSTMLTHSVFGEGDAASEALARVFGTEVLLMEERDEDWQRARFAGKLRNTATADGIPAITPELGGHSTFEPERIAAGVTGVLNVLKHLGMIEGEIVRPARQYVVRNHLTRVSVDRGGLFVPAVVPGDEVRAGDRLGILYSPRDFAEVATVVSPNDAVVLSVAENPVLHTGDSAAMLGKKGEEYAP
jgi:predicted deacylase